MKNILEYITAFLKKRIFDITFTAIFVMITVIGAFLVNISLFRILTFCCAALVALIYFIKKSEWQGWGDSYSGFKAWITGICCVIILAIVVFMLGIILSTFTNEEESFTLTEMYKPVSVIYTDSAVIVKGKNFEFSSQYIKDYTNKNILICKKEISNSYSCRLKDIYFICPAQNR
jgi:hypothetical protein